MKFPKTASQNADYVPLSDPSLPICSPYLGPSLTLPFIDIATWGPVVERLCSKWTADPSDRIVHEHIVFFFLLTAGFLSSLYLPIVSYLFRYLSSSLPTLMLYFCEPSQTHSHISHSKYSPFVTSVIYHLSLPLWRQAANSSSGVGLLKPFLSLRAHTEGGTFIDDYYIPVTPHTSHRHVAQSSQLLIQYWMHHWVPTSLNYNLPLLHQLTSAGKPKTHTRSNLSIYKLVSKASITLGSAPGNFLTI